MAEPMNLDKKTRCRDKYDRQPMGDEKVVAVCCGSRGEIVLVEID